MTFIEQLEARWQAGTQLCVGLDPFRERFPASVKAQANAIEQFNRAIVDATADLVCAFKPQFAHHAAEAAEAELKSSIAYIKQQHPNVPVILDAKRGDIGSTAAMYAREAFEHYGADAVTVNPYMGADTVLPFAEHSDKGVIVLCRTSNPSAADFQDRLIDGEPLYIHVARQAQEVWNQHGNLCLVVGATAPAEMARIRAAAPDLPLLVPGIGAQGGDLQGTVRYGQTSPGRGLMINASRSVIYASDADDFATAARREAQALRDQINALSGS